MGKVVAIFLMLWALGNSSLTKCAPLVSEELNLGGVHPGMSQASIRSKLGEARFVSYKNLGIYRISDGNEVHVLFNSLRIAETILVTWDAPSMVLKVEN